MSTDSGSTAAGDPRRRQADGTPPREDADTGAPGVSSSTPGTHGSSNEPDVTRRLETQPEASYRPHGRPGRHGNASGTNETEVLNTRDSANTGSPAPGTRTTPPTGVTMLRPERTRRATHRDGSVTRRAEPVGDAGTNRRTADEPVMPNREALLAAERERFGGIKFGAAFFGWLTATGMVVLLSALAAAIGAAVGVSTDTDLGAALDQAAANQSSGLIGAIITLIVLLLAYYAGGYVAGRMARFNGAKQGVAVWLWALVAAAVVIVLGLIFNDDIRSLTQLNSVAPLPQDLGDVSAGSWLALLASVVVSLVGAILGGLAGMRFHRRVDRAKFTPATA